ncbi:MAG TPA: hypothetical protein VN043_01985 [Rhodanobacter sp.]|nr:hypothetical protein [Rhodanobacter sp.]
MGKTYSRQVPAVIAPIEPGRITAAILDFVSEVPGSKVDSSKEPASEARRLASRAAQRAALTAGSLALPPGPLGWLTLLPELIAIWKIQGQMVSDIAAAYGRHATLGREQMMWCLFRHTAAQAFRDLVVRMGDRLIFQRMSWGVAQRVAKQVGVKITQRTLSKGVSRWLPVVGALGVGAYAYYDTGQVAGTAIDMFESEVTIEGSAGADDNTTGKPELAPKRKTAPKKETKVKRSTADKRVDKAVAGAARKIAGSARKAASKSRKEKPG